MVGVNMAFHDAICECFEGTMLEPCFHVAGIAVRRETRNPTASYDAIVDICRLDKPARKKSEDRAP